MDWMHEGPAAGLRKQHQFTKVKGGWVESATHLNEGTTEEETAIDDGLSIAQLRQALHSAVLEQEPANIQQVTDQQLYNNL